MNKSLFTEIIICVFLIAFSIQPKLFSQDFKLKSTNPSDTSWKYLGRPRPGMTPLRFPPESLLANYNWWWHGTPIFSPDLKEIHWSKYDRIVERGMIVYIKYSNNNWTSMQYAPFGNQNYFESCPVYSLSGDTIFFTSLRPGGFFFRTCRTTSGWTTPEPLNIPIPQGYAANFEFSMTRNGTIYFTLVDTTLHTDADIYKTKLINGEYQIPTSLGPIINSDSSDLNPYIDPYERFIIFASKRQGGFGIHDLYISKRNPDSTWNNPMNLGPTINSSFEDVFPNITPDSLYFFFTTAKYGDIGYNPYWISAQYIYNLVSVGIKETSTPPNDFYLEQNYPNPFNPETKIRFDIPENFKFKISNLKLVVYDILGKEVATLVNESLNPGAYEVNWDASQMPSGVYFYRLKTENSILTKKMLLIK